MLVSSSLSLVEPPLLSRMQPASAAVSPSMPVVDRRAVLTGAAAAVLAGVPAASFAESTLVTRQQAYTRYVPRIERARDFWATKLRKDIASSNWASISKELEPVGKKDKGGALMKAFGPMGLWSSSFSSKVISEKTTAMNAAVEELEEVRPTRPCLPRGSFVFCVSCPSPVSRLHVRTRC